MSAICLLVNGLVGSAMHVICLLYVGQNPSLQGAAHHFLIFILLE